MMKFLMSLIALCTLANSAFTFDVDDSANENYKELTVPANAVFGMLKENVQNLTDNNSVGTRAKAAASLPGLAIFETFSLPITAGKSGLRALRRAFIKAQGFRPQEDEDDEVELEIIED